MLVVLTLECVSVFWINLSSESSMSIDVVSVCKRKAQLTCNIQLFSHAFSLTKMSVWTITDCMQHSGLIYKLIYTLIHDSNAKKNLEIVRLIHSLFKCETQQFYLGFPPAKLEYTQEAFLFRSVQTGCARANGV